MLERFKGSDGKKALIRALIEQKIFNGNLELAAIVAELAEIKEFGSNTEIIQQGKFDSDLYFIIVGSVSIRINNREIAKRMAGSHIGEMGCIDPSVKRSATVKTIENTVVAKLSESTFSDLADKYPILWRKLAVELANRLREREKIH